MPRIALRLANLRRFLAKNLPNDGDFNNEDLNDKFIDFIVKNNIPLFAHYNYGKFPGYNIFVVENRFSSSLDTTDWFQLNDEPFDDMVKVIEFISNTFKRQHIQYSIGGYEYFNFEMNKSDIDWILCKTIPNMAVCLSCGTILHSKHRHDFVACDCSNQTFIDGGNEYSRRGGVNLSLICKCKNLKEAKKKSNQVHRQLKFLPY